MGQSLSIRIIKDGYIVADSHFHWCGYFSTTIELLRDIVTEHINNDTKTPIQLLESVGAKLEDNPKANRNDGLIRKTNIPIDNVDEEDEQLFYCDTFVEVDITNKVVNLFGSVFIEDDRDTQYKNPMTIHFNPYENIDCDNFLDFVDDWKSSLSKPDCLVYDDEHYDFVYD